MYLKTAFRNMHKYMKALPGDWDMIYFGYCYEDKISEPYNELLYQVKKVCPLCPLLAPLCVSKPIEILIIHVHTQHV